MFKQLTNIKQLQVRDCTFSGGFKRVTKVYSDRFHLNKTLGKLRWKDTKVVAVKVVDEDLDFEDEEPTLAETPKIIHTKKSSKPTASKRRAAKRVIPPPVHFILRCRIKQGNEFVYSPATEAVVNAKTINSWSNVSAFKQGIMSLLFIQDKEENIIVSKYSFSDARIIRIEQDPPEETTEQTESENKEGSTAKISKKDLHLMRRINLTDGDVILLSFKSDFENDEVLKVHSSSLGQYEKERLSSKREEDDFFGYPVGKQSRAKEEALQIFLTDSDDEDDE